MKVVHFISGIKSGGVEQFLYNYTSRINNKYLIDEFIIYQHKANDVSLRKLEEAKNTCIRIPSKTKHPLKNLWDTYKILKKIDPDIVHAHMNLMNFFPLSIAFLLKIPVRISHSHIATDNISLKYLVPWFKKLNIKFSNALFACGTLAGTYMYGRNKFRIIPNAIDIEQYKYSFSDRVNLRRKYNVSDNDIIIGNVGRLTKQKNQLFLIKIFNEYVKENKHSKLFIIGGGELRRKLEKQIELYGLKDKVLLIHPVKNVAKYYSMMDLFLLPSLYEGFPVSAIEAQASGLPCYMTNTIDHEAKMSSYSAFLSLDNLDNWVRILSSRNKNRKEIDKSNLDKYNINIVYDDLFIAYADLLRKQS